MPRLIRVNPDHLDAWVETAGRLNETLADRAELLVGEYSRVVPTLDWGTLDAGSLLSAMGDYISANEVDRSWVATIAQAFRDLDARYSDGVPESIIVDHLAAVGLDAGREAVTFDDPVALGMPPSSGFANDPVSTATGNMVEAEVDLRLPDSSGPLRMPRTYNSRFRRDGAFGPGWTSWLDVGLDRGLVRGLDRGMDRGLDRDRTGDANRAVVTFPDGHRVTFLRLAGQWMAPPGCHARLTLDAGGGFRLDHANGDVWTLDAAGRLERVQFGVHTVSLARDDDGRVVRLEHTNGRSVEVDWAGPRVAAVASDDGQRATYAYDENGHLVAVTTGGGTRRHEVSSDGLLVASFDADGVLAFRNSYDDQDRVVSQLSPFGRLTRFTYALSGITIVDDDQDGPRTTFIHNDKGRLVGVVDDDDNHQATTFDAHGNAVASIDRTGGDHHPDVRRPWQAGADH